MSKWNFMLRGESVRSVVGLLYSRIIIPRYRYVCKYLLLEHTAGYNLVRSWLWLCNNFWCSVSKNVISVNFNSKIIQFLWNSIKWLHSIHICHAKPIANPRFIIWLILKLLYVQEIQKWWLPHEWFHLFIFGCCF